MTTAEAILRAFQSDNVSDSNGEVANIVDVLQYLAVVTKKVANSITPGDAMPGHDAAGGTISSLTEAVMGVTGGLVQIAEAINGLAGAVEVHGGIT